MKAGSGGGARNIGNRVEPKAEPRPHKMNVAGVSQIGASVAFSKQNIRGGQGYSTPQGPKPYAQGPGGGRTVSPCGSQHGTATRQMPAGKDILSEYGPERSKT